MRLPAVIGINPQNGKREQLTGAACGQLAPPPGFDAEGQAFRPAGGDIGERQSIEIAAIDVCATMGHQVGFQKSWLGLIPCLKGADGDLLLEQRSSSRRGEATLALFALGTQEAICYRCAHREQLAPALLCQVEMLMPL